mgnify:CR=1 FL=1
MTRLVTISLLAVLALGRGAGAQSPPLSAGGRTDVGTPRPAPGSLTRSRRENPAVSVQDLVKIAGQNASPLRGMGIVTGLPKTGDSGAELALRWQPLLRRFCSCVRMVYVKQPQSCAVLPGK